MRFSASLFVVVQLLGSGGVSAAKDESSMEVARQHYATGLAMIQQGDYPKALQEFNTAYDTRPYFAVLYNIAQTLIALDRPLEAATTLSRYLKEGQDRVSTERIAYVKDQIALLESFLGVLYVSTEPPGARITVDGRAIGRTPLGEPVRLATGTCSISATLDDGRRVERWVTIGQGTRHEVVLQLPPSPLIIEHDKIVVAAQADPLPKAPSGPSRLRKVLPYTLVGVGVALAGGALGTYLLWERSAYSKWQDAQPALQNTQKGSPDFASAAAESNRRADSFTMAKRTVLGLSVVGGASVVAGAALYLFDRRSTGALAPPTVAWNGGNSFTLEWRSSW
jgi:tetratricopeptide (TPR) repeat protein